MSRQSGVTENQGSNSHGEDHPLGRCGSSSAARGAESPGGSRRLGRTSAHVVSFSPFRCRMWDLHDRIESHITEESCKAEIESFSRHGQLVPVLGRPLRGDPDYDVELVFGARRLFVARHLNRPLLVEIREMTDKEAITAMDIENRHRSDISPYERGLSFVRWLRAGYFDSQEEIARSLRMSPAQVSRLLKIARLPSVIVDTFRNPSEIREAWALEIMNALDDPARRAQTLQRARALAKLNPRSRPEVIVRKLLAVPRQREVRPRVRDDVVRQDGKTPLFRIRYLERSVAFVVPADKISTDAVRAIRAAIVDALQAQAARANCAGAASEFRMQAAVSS